MRLEDGKEARPVTTLPLDKVSSSGVAGWIWLDCLQFTTPARGLFVLTDLVLQRVQVLQLCGFRTAFGFLSLFLTLDCGCLLCVPTRASCPTGVPLNCKLFMLEEYEALKDDCKILGSACCSVTHGMRAKHHVLPPFRVAKKP